MSTYTTEHELIEIDGETGEVIKYNKKQTTITKALRSSFVMMIVHEESPFKGLGYCYQVSYQGMALIMNKENVVHLSDFNLRKISKMQNIKSIATIKSNVCKLIERNLIKRLEPKVYMINPSFYICTSLKNGRALQEKYDKLQHHETNKGRRKKEHVVLEVVSV